MLSTFMSNTKILRVNSDCSALSLIILTTFIILSYCAMNITIMMTITISTNLVNADPQISETNSTFVLFVSINITHVQQTTNYVLLNNINIIFQ